MLRSSAFPNSEKEMHNGLFKFYNVLLLESNVQEVKFMHLDEYGSYL